MAAPTANPYASAFFMAGAPLGTTAPPASEMPGLELRMSAPAGMAGMERRLPPLPPLRTGSNKSASPGERAVLWSAVLCADLLC